MTEETSTVDEVVWTDTKEIERDRDDFFRFLLGRQDRIYDDEPDREPLSFTKINKDSGRRFKRVISSLFTALALIGSLVVYSEVANNGADALIADGSCPGGGIIEPGETVNGIAARYGVNAQRIIELNNLDNPDLIIAGHCLDLGLQTACNGHIIGKDETLTRLATRYNTTINELTQLNNIGNPDQIETGRCLLLADTATAEALPNPTDELTAVPPEQVASPEVREVVDEIIEDMEPVEEIVANVVAEIVQDIEIPDALNLDEVVDLGLEIQADAAEQVESEDIADLVEAVEDETPVDTVDAGQVPDAIEEAIEEAIVDHVQDEIRDEIEEALSEQHEINTALAYIDALSVPDPGPVSMDQAWAWYHEGGGPVMEVTDVARLLRWAGFCTHGVEELVLATATVGGESGFKPYVLGDVNTQYEGDVSVGFGQIYWSPGNGFTSENRRPELNINPRDNVQTMYGMYSWRMDRFGWENRFDDWYGHGPGVRDHEDTARQAVADIGGCG